MEVLERAKTKTKENSKINNNEGDNRNLFDKFVDFMNPFKCGN